MNAAYAPVAHTARRLRLSALPIRRSAAAIGRADTRVGRWIHE